MSVGDFVQYGNWSNIFPLPDPPKIFPVAAVVFAIVATALIIVFAVILFAYYVHRRQKIRLRNLFDELQATSAQTADIDSILLQNDPSRALIEQIDYLPYQFGYEIDYERLDFGHISFMFSYRRCFGGWVVVMKIPIQNRTNYKYLTNITLPSKFFWNFDGYVISEMERSKEIGHGQFGSVKIGELHPLNANITPLHEKVAIKQPKLGHHIAEDLRQLLNELKVMIAIGAHVNIVRLIGAVTERISQGELYIVMEYCERFSLLSVLKDMSCSMDTYGEKDLSPECSQNYGCFGTENRYQPFVSNISSVQNMVTNLMLFAYQIANGMIFVSSKNIVHRNLMARNILVAANDIIKIADYRLARQMDKQYNTMNGEIVPIASMAIETFENNCYSTQTDIWSFGVLLWEMFSFGSNPLDGYYPALEPKEIHSFLKDYHRLKCPEHSPTEMYNLMQNCWKENPLERPSFRKCKNMIEKRLFCQSPEELNELRNKFELPIVEIDQRTAEHVTIV